MKYRNENSGLHLFDRKSGLHILMDEYTFPKELISIAPRTLSIALTDLCNLNCNYCYAPKNKRTLQFDFIKEIAMKFDELGTLELTFGGGEPFMYPKVSELVKWIWLNTKLGINITTNGQLITQDLIENIKDYVSSLRFSIDGIEPKYSSVKKVPFSKIIDNINLVRNNIPFGINVIVNKDSTADVENVIELAIDLGAIDILIIPEHFKGEFLLCADDWRNIEDIIKKYHKKIQINVTYDASSFIKSEYLETEVKKEFLFAHISTDKKLKTYSYLNDGFYIENQDEIDKYLLLMNQN